MPSISYGQRLPGTLTVSSTPAPDRGGCYCDLWTFVGTAGDTVRIYEASATFDCYMFLLDTDGVTVLAFDDDDPNDGTNSIIVYTLLTSGTFTIETTTYSGGVTGAYTLSLAGGAGVSPWLEDNVKDTDGVTLDNHNPDIQPTAQGYKKLFGQGLVINSDTAADVAGTVLGSDPGVTLEDTQIASDQVSGIPLNIDYDVTWHFTIPVSLTDQHELGLVYAQGTQNDGTTKSGGRVIWRSDTETWYVDTADWSAASPSITNISSQAQSLASGSHTAVIEVRDTGITLIVDGSTVLTEAGAYLPFGLIEANGATNDVYVWCFDEPVFVAGVPAYNEPYTFLDPFTDSDKGVWLHTSPDGVSWTAFGSPLCSPNFFIVSDKVMFQGAYAPGIGEAQLVTFMHAILLTEPSMTVEFTTSVTESLNSQVYLGGAIFEFNYNVGTGVLGYQMNVLNPVAETDGTISISWTPGDTFTLGLAISGGNAIGTVNGTTYATLPITLPAGLFYTSFGIQSDHAVDVSWDNFVLNDALHHDATTDTWTTTTGLGVTYLKVAEPASPGSNMKATGARLGNRRLRLNYPAYAVPLLGGNALSERRARQGILVLATNTERVAFEVYFAGVGNSENIVPMDYGVPTPILLDNPTAGYEYIVDVPATDLAGFLRGNMGNVKLRREGAGGNYAGDVIVRAIELYYKEANA